MALEESPSRVGSLGVPSRRSAGQAYAEQTFFSPAQSTVPASRFPSSTVVIARPTGGHFGSQICDASCIVSPWRNEGRLALLAFCHGLLKFEPQNARLRTAKVTGAVSGKGLCKEACSARKGMGASQLWWWCRLSFFRGDGGQSASEL